jgi:hypothetical protein
MTQANVGLVEGTSMDKTNALHAAFEKDSTMRLGTNESTVKIRAVLCAFKWCNKLHL